MNAPSSPDSWQYRDLNSKNPGLDHLSNGIIDLVKAGHNVIAARPISSISNGLNRFAAAYPDRYISFGISEQNMVSAAAGIATCGVTPFIATFSSFLALFSLRADPNGCAYGAQPVRLVGHHTAFR